MSIRICNSKLSVKNNKLQLYDATKCCKRCTTGYYWNGTECVPAVDCETCTDPNTHYDSTLLICVPNCSSTVCNAGTHWDPLLCRCEPDCPAPPTPCEAQDEWRPQVCMCLPRCCDQPCPESHKWDKILCKCVPIHHKCIVLEQRCEDTEEPTTVPDVYESEEKCIEVCMQPCQTTGCDFEVQYFYLKEWGFHICNNAEWDAFVGGRFLGHINLNNLSDGGSRETDWFGVVATDFDLERCVYTFNINCTLSYCHAEVPALRIRKDGVILYEIRSGGGGNWSMSGNAICIPPVSTPRLSATIPKLHIGEEVPCNCPTCRRVAICRDCPAYQKGICQITEKPMCANLPCPIDRW